MPDFLLSFFRLLQIHYDILVFDKIGLGTW